MKKIFYLSIIICLFAYKSLFAWSAPAQSLTSLQSYTGIWNMPNARVLPDWNMRIKYGQNEPYFYYGGALGVWDRLEIHGQFTRVNTLQAFEGEGYGDYKDRSAGLRLVLFKEDELFPQLAIGAFDVTGTALFSSRYIVASKMFDIFDLSFGLGQGILAGERLTSSVNGDQAFDFLVSSPKRKTRPFGGIEWHISPDLTLSAEYSSIDYSQMFGFRDRYGEKIKEDNSKTPVNIGLKYKISPYFQAQIALMRGRNLGFGLNLDFPLEPTGILDWKKEKPYCAQEKARWQALEADNAGLAKLLTDTLYADGFTNVETSASNNSIWTAFNNSRYLSSARCIGRVASILDQTCPPRIKTFYINIKSKNQIIQSLKTDRKHLQDFLSSRIDKNTFLTFADLELYADQNWKKFTSSPDVSPIQKSDNDWWNFRLQPRLKTFINNRKGFFHTKGLIKTRGEIYPWAKGQLVGELEFTVFNQFDDVDFSSLEDESTRTDNIEYEKRSTPRLSMLAFDQTFNLPHSILARFSMGYFESAYGGVGLETFRFFNNGIWGAGLESEIVAKRSYENNFTFRDTPYFKTAFINLYAQIWPGQGLEAGLKLGRFLAGDIGGRLELRRSFKYFTLGGWITKTKTDVFDSPENQDAMQKGVFIEIPFAVFTDKERKGHFGYEITSFTRDQGATVSQPNTLYPLNPWSTPEYTRQIINDMHPN